MFNDTLFLSNLQIVDYSVRLCYQFTALEAALKPWGRVGVQILVGIDKHSNELVVGIIGASSFRLVARALA